MKKVNEIKEAAEEKIEVVKSNGKKVAKKVAIGAGIVAGVATTGLITYLVVKGHGNEVIEVANQAAEVGEEVVKDVVEVIS